MSIKELKRLRDKYFQYNWKLRADLRGAIYVGTSTGIPLCAELDKIDSVCMEADVGYVDKIGEAIQEVVKETFDLVIKEAEEKEVKELELYKYFQRSWTLTTKEAEEFLERESNDLTPIMSTVLDFIRARQGSTGAIHIRLKSAWRVQLIQSTVELLWKAGLIKCHYVSGVKIWSIVENPSYNHC